LLPELAAEIRILSFFPEQLFAGGGPRYGYILMRRVCSYWSEAKTCHWFHELDGTLVPSAVSRAKVMGMTNFPRKAWQVEMDENAAFRFEKPAFL